MKNMKSHLQENFWWYRTLWIDAVLTESWAAVASTQSWFQSFILAMEFWIKFRVTIRFPTNVSLNCYFFVHLTIHATSARIMEKMSQYWVWVMFVLYIYWKQNGVGAAMFFMDIQWNIFKQKKLQGDYNAMFNDQVQG